MKIYLKVALSGVLLLSLVFISIGKETTPPFIEMEVKGMRIDTIGQTPVVILTDKEEQRALPIWIGLPEANAINKELNHLSTPRPMTHDLLHSILTQANIKVKEVKIVDVKNNTYYATLFLIMEKNLIEIDARPSDAIVIALKSRAPILVSTKIVEEHGISLIKKTSLSERYGIRIQELTPSLAFHFKFKGKKGVLVSEIIPGSPSEASGIKAGDIITKVDLKEVGSIKEFEEIFENLKEGTPVEILIFRDEKFQKVNLIFNP